MRVVLRVTDRQLKADIKMLLRKGATYDNDEIVVLSTYN
jgi:hypothetical protein